MKNPKQVKKMVLNSDCVPDIHLALQNTIALLTVSREDQMKERNPAYTFFDVGIEKDTDDKG